MRSIAHCLLGFIALVGATVLIPLAARADEGHAANTI